MPSEGFVFRSFGDAQAALLIAAEVLRFFPDLDAEVGPWDDELLARHRRVTAKGSDQFLDLLGSRFAEARLFFDFDVKISDRPGDGSYRPFLDAAV